MNRRDRFERWWNWRATPRQKRAFAIAILPLLPLFWLRYIIPRAWELTCDIAVEWYNDFWNGR